MILSCIQIEAKLFSLLSKGVKKASFFDQVAWNADTEFGADIDEFYERYLRVYVSKVMLKGAKKLHPYGNWARSLSIVLRHEADRRYNQLTGAFKSSRGNGYGAIGPDGGG